ncbi:D-glycero-beta-D-manno-heptose 1-phosphate adenylyltransferase, partial [bacterium]|nr:D-glycero-beta-D-manno-heptose 1-phosphate adenylyltransferase [bacterium]
LLTPNLPEFEAVVGRCDNDSIMAQRAKKLISKLELEGLLVTLSERGMALFRPQQEPLMIPTEAREVYDVTGAGDTVIATLAATIATGGDMVEAVKLANLAAGVVVGKFGTASASRDELCLAAETQQLRRQQAQFSNIVSEQQLLEQVKRLRARGETIAMTNGCFDILHPGHIHYLRKASQMADHLIVAVNSDASVSSLKGPTRPINALDSRMALLAALDSVDWVVPFNESTPARLIGEVLPDLLIKGGDYKAEDLAGYEAVTQHGGDVVIIDFEEGYSTTAIIEKIQALDTE